MSRLAAAAAWCVPLYVCVTHAAAMAVYSFSDVFTGVFAASMSTLTAVVMHDFFSEFAAVDAMQVLRAAQYTTLFALWMSGYSSNAAAVVQGFVMYGLYCAGDAAQQLRYEPLRSQVLHAAHHTATLLLLSLCSVQHLSHIGAPILVIYSFSTLPLCVRKLVPAHWKRLRAANDVALVLLWAAFRMPCTLAYTVSVFRQYGAGFAGFQLLLALNCMNVLWFVSILRGAQHKLRRNSDTAAAA